MTPEDKSLCEALRDRSCIDQSVLMADAIRRIEALSAEVERLKEFVEARRSLIDTCMELKAEREAHAKTKAALLAWQMGEGDTETEARANRAEADLSIARAHERTLCDTLDSEIAKRQDAEHRADRAENLLDLHVKAGCTDEMHLIAERNLPIAESRADRAEAVLAGMRAWLLKLLCGENTARDAAIAADDLVVPRVRQGRINLIEDAADELDALCRKHNVSLPEVGRG